MRQSVPRSDTPIPAATHEHNIQQVGYGVRCLVNNGYDWTDIFWIDLGWRWTASITAMSCCLSRCFQNVAYSQNNILLTTKFVIILCSVISQGKVVALDRWGRKWNHLSTTPRLNTDYAKNYCNRTLIVKVIVENVVTWFYGTQCTFHPIFGEKIRWTLVH